MELLEVIKVWVSFEFREFSRSNSVNRLVKDITSNSKVTYIAFTMTMFAENSKLNWVFLLVKKYFWATHYY